MPITKIHARQIYDSRGNPTVEVDLFTEKGKRALYKFYQNLKNQSRFE